MVLLCFDALCETCGRPPIRSLESSANPVTTSLRFGQQYWSNALPFDHMGTQNGVGVRLEEQISHIAPTNFANQRLHSPGGM
jgi:hypothetical protein